MIRYEITGDDLVELVALSCAHAVSHGDVPDERADQLMDAANDVLKRVGVRYPSKFWERCSRALEAQLHLLDERPTNPGSPEDPYLWESGT